MKLGNIVRRESVKLRPMAGKRDDNGCHLETHSLDLTDVSGAFGLAGAASSKLMVGNDCGGRNVKML